MLRLIFFIPVFVIDTVFCTLLAIIGGIFNPYSRYNNAIMKLWSRISLLAAGIHMKISGLENIQPDTSYIVVANHQSHMDIPVATAALPLNLRIISKKELFRIPVFGWGMRAVGILKIDRSNQKKSIETLKAAEKIVRTHRLSILAFPEGTRSPDGNIHSFKKGPFILAINSGLSILPVSISGTRKILPKGKLRLYGGKVKVVIHPPININGYSIENRNALVEKTGDLIQKGFTKNYD
jgi:1-acyl-sn-glycerol-3-phosphate acyltransferase